ncbi:MAG: hypothetical protein N3C12_04205 [Candidatus Binatia bacterium]|nr:hypothetical protein [Candidatus Binatia bacterium]
MPEPMVVGIDIAGQTFLVPFGLGSPVKRFLNNRNGRKTLLRRLRRMAVELIVMGPKETLVRDLVGTREAAGFNPTIVDPGQA